MNYEKINIKRVKKISLTHPTTYQFTQLHLFSINLYLFCFLYLYLLTMSSKKTFDPNALKRPVTRSKTAHEREGKVVCKDFIILLRSEERRVGKECRFWWLSYD